MADTIHDPSKLSDEELLQIAAQSIEPYESCGIGIDEYEPETECAVEAYGSELVAFARAAIAADRARAALAEPEPEGPPMFKPDEVHPFVVRHYTDDQRPSIKGNGFDGLEVGEDRQEAEEFIAWINARLFPSRSN